MEEITYNKAITELETILQTMQSDRCDIDKLSALTRRAAELIKLCRARLTATDQELQQILASLQQQQ
ncbi:MAG: exodeoxyribonuclease VII small subunit [Bacteroidales bacterium]|nr:exodeoxyribonuclease VII small subunit [Bacteroidales bacterium]